MKSWRILEDDEIPQVGDEGWNEAAKKWDVVNIPSMWLAGGSRIEGTKFRRLQVQPNTEDTKMPTGQELIDAERTRQIEVEGYSPSHDARYQKGELTMAAIAYERAALEEIETGSILEWPPEFWPWGQSWWKPTGGPVRLLTKAGALFTAAAHRALRFNSGEVAEKLANELIRDVIRCAEKIHELQRKGGK